MKTDDGVILMGHGGGGVLTRLLIEESILSELGNPILARLDDSACFNLPGGEVAMTTDSYVVDPIFFPGGDIGKLAVCGTVNDLAMQAAEPKYMSLALIIEEGMAIADLKRIIHSVGETARAVGVQIVTGDTKVIERRSRRAGCFINTTGIGVRVSGTDTSVWNARPGDVVLITGAIGEHGMAVMNARENLGLESGLRSDVAPLWTMVKELLGAVKGVHCLRDPTRGGVAAALVDVAQASKVMVRLREQDIPVPAAVRGACDILGIEPLTVANEGKAVVVCAAADQAAALAALRGCELGKGAKVIGRIAESGVGTVVMETGAGGERTIDLPTGESLPRIC